MLNKCMFIGNLGADPEMRSTAGGQTVCSLSIGCSSRRKNGEGVWVEETEWVKAVCFGNLATAVGQNLTKGRQVYLEGKMRTRKFQDRDGKDRYTTEILADDIKFLGPKPGGHQSGNDANSGHSNSDDIPY